jgi:hypothetical protein
MHVKSFFSVVFNIEIPCQHYHSGASEMEPRWAPIEKTEAFSDGYKEMSSILADQ